MEVKKELKDNICTLYISGVLDYSTMGPFVEEIALLDKGLEKVIVDFEGLEFIDSTGIGAIVNLAHEANAKQFEIELRSIIDEIKELFDTIGVFQILELLQKESD